MCMGWICCKKWYVLSLTQESLPKLHSSILISMILISLSSTTDYDYEAKLSYVWVTQTGHDMYENELIFNFI